MHDYLQIWFDFVHFFFLSSSVFVIYQQTNAGAVVLTDFIFWVIIVPFLEMKQYNVNPVNKPIQVIRIEFKEGIY